MDEVTNEAIAAEEAVSGKTRKPRAKKPEIKIDTKKYNELCVYCKAVEGVTAAKIMDKLLTDFLAQEDVIRVVEANSVNTKKRKTLEKKQAQIAKLQAEIEAIKREIQG
ncbi:MAG: hypothetical protein HFI93_01185 [Lachnospiraceae bacterium]|nr:hypothetical protein [Lachnospiraceae bacterium]